MIAALEHLMVDDTAGDPMSGLKWTRKTTAKISRALRAAGIIVSKNTVSRLLRQLGYSLRVNRKKLSRRSPPPQRDRQFRYIHALRSAFARDALPVISVDTKKKELVGRFKNPGAAWSKVPTAVNDHDFRSDAVGMAIPYGIYDVRANVGHVSVGTSHDTPAFAVDAIARWWRQQGRRSYPQSQRLLILADSGGSNGARVRAWKYALQHRLCDVFGLTVTICHYPPGASKWNPIEHRLFSEISKHWAGRPLDSYATVIKYLRNTTTTTGLSVQAALVRRPYRTGVKITKQEMADLNLTPRKVLPDWNYTIRPAPALVRSCS